MYCFPKIRITINDEYTIKTDFIFIVLKEILRKTLINLCLENEIINVNKKNKFVLKI